MFFYTSLQLRTAGRNRLNPCFSGICSFIAQALQDILSSIDVLILVLVEYVLLFLERRSEVALCGRLNPCFSGICSFIRRGRQKRRRLNRS